MTRSERACADQNESVMLMTRARANRKSIALFRPYILNFNSHRSILVSR